MAASLCGDSRSAVPTCHAVAHVPEVRFEVIKSLLVGDAHCESAEGEGNQRCGEGGGNS